MAHNIMMKDGKGQMFSVGDLPWHGLGTNFKEKLDYEAALREGGLDYSVEIHEMQTKFGLDVPDRFATVRMDTNKVLSTVGKRYEVLQNRDAFSLFDPVVDRSEGVYETGGVFGIGERCWLMAKLPDYIKVKGHDAVQPYITVLNSHDGSQALTAFIHFTRIVCANTLSQALKENLNKITIRHTKNAAAELETAYELLGIIPKHTKLMDEAFNFMAATRITVKHTKEYLDLLIPNKTDITIEELENSKEIKTKQRILEFAETGIGMDTDSCKGTVFGAYNAVTGYLDHYGNYKDRNSKLESVWFGDTAKLRGKAFELAIQFALNNEMPKN